MKKFIALSLILLTSFAFGQIPETILVGKVAVPTALATAKQVRIKSQDTNAGVVKNGNFDLPLLKSKKGLVVAVAKMNLGYTVIDPRKEVRLFAEVLDTTGAPVLQGWNTFYLYMEKGKWKYPDDAGKFWFQLCDRKISVKDSVSANVVNKVNGEIQKLELVNGVITIPFWVSNDSNWNTYVITFKDGSIVNYDGASGKRVRATEVSHFAGVWGIDGLVDGEILNNTLFHTAQPQYGWNPVVEVTTTTSGPVTLDIAIREWSEWSKREEVLARPTRLYITTLDDVRAGKLPVEVEFSPQGWDNGAISVPFGIGTYYIWSEWSPQWTESFHYNIPTPTTEGGGKG